MAVINFAHREITAKLVYFGSSGAGCNTNVRALYERVDPERKSKLHKFGPADSPERSWYFDLKSTRTEITGFSVRLRIYSMPGGLELPAHRHEVMDQVDAIVLVADSRDNAAQANEAALMELEQILSDQGLELAAMPVVLQVNQTDREGARAESAVVFDLNPYGFPVFSAAAKSGIGVRDTFDGIVDIALARIRDNMAGGDGAITLTAEHRPDVIDAEDTLRGHLEAIQEETGAPPESSSDQGEEVVATPTPPTDEIEVPFQPRAFAGSYPVRVVAADLADGQVFIDIELERMGGGELRQLRVRLANRPTDVPAAPRAETHAPPEPLAGITDHLPDKVAMHGFEQQRDLPPVMYGILGVAGGILVGLLAGFLLLS